MGLKTVIHGTVSEDKKWKEIMNEASFNRKLRRLQNAEARARRLREELSAARATWQRNYDKLRVNPLWVAHRTALGEAVEYDFNDILNLTEVSESRS